MGHESKRGLSLLPLLKPSTPPHCYVGCDARTSFLPGLINQATSSSFGKNERGPKYLCIPIFLSDLEVEFPFLHETVPVHWVGEVGEARHRTATHHLHRVLPGVQEGLELEFSVIVSFSHTFQTLTSTRRLSPQRPLSSGLKFLLSSHTPSSFLPRSSCRDPTATPENGLPF